MTYCIVNVAWETMDRHSFMSRGRGAMELIGKYSIFYSFRIWQENWKNVLKISLGTPLPKSPLRHTCVTPFRATITIVVLSPSQCIALHDSAVAVQCCFNNQATNTVCGDWIKLKRTWIVDLREEEELHGVYIVIIINGLKHQVLCSAMLSSDDDFLSLLAALPCQVAQRNRYQNNDGYAHADADPYDFLVESAGWVTWK